MPEDVIDLKARLRQRIELQESGERILALQKDVNEVIKTEYESLGPETIGTAFLHYAARIACQLGMSSKQFSLAAKEAFKEVAKELRG